MAPDPEFETLLEYVRDARGFDYTGYKRPTLGRRFAKRMDSLRIDRGYAGYREYLDGHPEEFEQLFDTILINVTQFFRDPETWAYLEREIMPRIAQQSSEREIRAWSSGCASGEEAFTLAMLMAEALGEEAFRTRVKIYATDVDEDALRRGRHGIYTSKDLEPVPERLRKKYFQPTNAEFVFRPELRRSVIFGRHDVIQDPPISKIDLLLSRNTLMYFNADVQSKILENFHFSLRDDGFLVLGKSEVFLSRSQLFEPVDLKRRVFRKASAPRRNPAPLPPDLLPERSLGEVAADALMREAGFEASSTAQVVVDRESNLALANLQARIMFGLAMRDVGRPFHELELSYRPVELRSRIEQAYKERHAIAVRDVEWQVGSETRWLDVQVAPLVSPAGEALGVGVAFTDVSRYKDLTQALDLSRREAETAYEELQSTVEELETTNEELQSTNEELETTNEELQSTNEELETMNEELQSTNEELEAINDELQLRTEELHHSSAFLESVLGSLSVAVIAVDRNFTVAAWNAGAEELWGMRRFEVEGKNMFSLDTGLPVDRLRKPIREILAGAEQLELRLQATNRRGRPVECQIICTALKGPEGDTAGAIVLVRAEPVK